jgi:hypothetical protein
MRPGALIIPEPVALSFAPFETQRLVYLPRQWHGARGKRRRAKLENRNSKLGGRVLVGAENYLLTNGGEWLY